MFEILVFCINMLLLNNVIDKYFIVIGVVFLTVVYFGLIVSFFPKGDYLSKGGSGAYFVSFSASSLIVMIFMYM